MKQRDPVDFCGSSMRAAMSMLVVAVILMRSAVAATVQASAAQDPVGASIASAERVVSRTAPFATLQGFVENKRQWPSDVLFFARQGATELTVRADALALRVVEPMQRSPSGGPDVIPGSDRAPVPREFKLHEPVVFHFLEHGKQSLAQRVVGEGALPTLHHFLLGAQRVSGVHGFSSVWIEGVAPGVSLRVRIAAHRFEYDVVAEPGADLGAFGLQVDSALNVQVSGAELALDTSSGTLRQRITAAWTDDGSGARSPLAAEFCMDATSTAPSAEPDSSGPVIGFRAPDWSGEQRLVIDPTLEFLTYVGGPGGDDFVGFDVSASGEVFLSGRATTGMPVTGQALQGQAGSVVDTWIGKLSSDAAQLEWATFLGGSKSDDTAGVRVSPDGTVVVVGHTWSTDFPTTPGTLQPTHSGGIDIWGPRSDLYMCRLTPDGSALVWSTFLGGPADYEQATHVDLQPNGDIVVTGDPWTGAGLPLTPNAFDPNHDDNEDFILAISGDGTQLKFVAYFACLVISGVTTDSESNIYICGMSESGYGVTPTTPGVLKEAIVPPDYSDGFVAKISPGGDQLLWSTLFGGTTGGESCIGMTVDPAGAVYLVGGAGNGNFPVTPGAFDSIGNDGGDGFISKLLPCATGIVWSTYLGSPEPFVDGLKRIRIDRAGNPVVIGDTIAPGFPVTPDAYQQNFVGPFLYADGHLTKMDPFGESLVYSTWFGGGGSDSSLALEVDEQGRATYGLQSSSTDFAAPPGVYDPTHNGADDIVVARFDLGLAPWKMMGFGLKGAKDVPNLMGSGSLVAGSPTRLSVRGAKPSTLMWAVIGFSKAELPLLGGTLVPTPDIALPLPSNATGGLDISFPWPTFAPGTDVYFQFWVLDLGAPQAWAATNALQAMVP